MAGPGASGQDPGSPGFIGNSQAGNEKEKAELEKKLAEGLIDGQTYYARLQELQQGETLRP